MAEQTINIPQLLAVLLFGFLAVRWYFSSSESDSSSGSGGSGVRRPRQVDPARVEQVAQMFPQLNRRDIMWDLQRNGGSVQATTERILGGRGLEAVSFGLISQLCAIRSGGHAISKELPAWKPIRYLKDVVGFERLWLTIIRISLHLRSNPKTSLHPALFRVTYPPHPNQPTQI